MSVMWRIFGYPPLTRLRAVCLNFGDYMETINFEGWDDCVRLANSAIELVATTAVGPRIVHLSVLGGPNLLHIDADLRGKVAEGDKWVNYGGHRLWHAPEVTPRTYAPDNDPVLAEFENGTLVLTQPIEKTTGIEKEIRVTIADGDIAAVRLDHVITNHNPWAIELAPWALTVVAEGGRVILPQEPYASHGPGHFAPVRPLVLWSFSEMGDARWTWGSKYIQLRSDASLDNALKVGTFSTEGWGAYVAAGGDLLIIFTEPDPVGPEVYTDLGSSYETFTKGAFQELETLGPIELIEPGDSVEHTQRWAIVKGANLPHDDAGLAKVLPDIIESARSSAYEA